MKKRKLVALLVVLAVLAISAVALSYVWGRGDPEAVATSVAREWTSSSIDRTSDVLAGAAVGGIPGAQQIAAMVIQQQIRERVSWTYSKPSKLGDDQYEVTATAIAPVNIRVLLIEKRYALSGNFILLINTKDKKVVDWRFANPSFRAMTAP